MISMSASSSPWVSKRHSRKPDRRGEGLGVITICEARVPSAESPQDGENRLEIIREGVSVFN